ncbi:Synaptic vesicle 2-related protein-like isoform X1 [Oopsacas minuta]|uniref:Synaptic vesicle 2-related protein-like isoform X1 n=1 Tax=Oopsacas minuta TaxID=111878 RepID=A0AAV7K1H6_9METZ|nr:Synaptic vesicle 2-related protein-like isoform X1 [Oopsacas minuta]
MNHSRDYGNNRNSETIGRGEEGELESSENLNFTIDRAIEKIGYGLFQSKLSIFTALLWMSDSMELMLLTIISPTLQCLWSLSSYDVAIITVVVFAGEALGSLAWGILSDKFGRRRILWISTFFLVYFGLVTSLAPTFNWVLTVRFCVGISLSALTQSITYFTEFLPTRYRSSSILLLQLAWAGGSVIECLLAILVLERLGWRYMIGFTTIPGILVLFIIPCIPKSPRYLLECDELGEAYQVLKSGAKQNCRALPPGELVHSVPSELPLIERPQKQKGNLLELASREYRLTSLLLSMIWYIGGFCYFGAVLLTTGLFQYDTHCVTRVHTNNTITDTRCKVLSEEELIYSLLISFGEFPGILVAVLFNDILGRKLTTIILFLIGSLFTLLLNICTGVNDKIIKTVFLFTARACISGSLQVVYVYTPEVYATHIRSSALSMANLMARFGMMTTSFAAVILLQTSFYAAITLYGVTGVIGAILTFLLPYETKGRNIGEYTEHKFIC